MTLSFLGVIVTPPPPRHHLLLFGYTPRHERVTRNKIDFAIKQHMLACEPKLKALCNLGLTVQPPITIPIFVGVTKHIPTEVLIIDE